MTNRPPIKLVAANSVSHANISHIRAASVEKWYAMDETKVCALRELSIEIGRGEFVALCGTSGSGKSTLLNLLGGLDSATSGNVLIEGFNLTRMSPQELDQFRATHLGFVFQTFNLLPVLTALENVEYPLLKMHLSRDERTHLAREALVSVGLEKQLHHRPAQLSGGQRQRVALARAFVHRPKLIIADEPTANLDRKTAAEVLDVLGNLNQKFGVTVIVATHDPLVMAKAQRRIYIADGALAPEEPLQGDVHATRALYVAKIA